MTAPINPVMAELAPCPFCCDEAELTYQPCDLSGFNGKSWSASCRGALDADCFAATYAQFKKREYAIDAWNRRTHHAELAAMARDSARYRVLRDVWGGYQDHGAAKQVCVSTPRWRGDWPNFDAAMDDVLLHNSAQEDGE